VRLEVGGGSYIGKYSGIKEVTITAGQAINLSCSLIQFQKPLQETDMLWVVGNRTLLNINRSGFNELVKTNPLEAANVSFGIPSYTPCPSPCQLENNTQLMTICSYGNVLDQVLLHILIPAVASLPWWFYLFPAWIGVIFILVLSNVLSYVFNQRLRLRLSLPPTPAQGNSARINEDSNSHLDPCSLLQEARQRRASPATNSQHHLSPPREYRGQTF